MEEIKFPVTHDKCPVCGEKEGLVRIAMDDLREDSKIHKESFPEGIVNPIPLLDQKHPPAVILAKSVKIPTINIYYEVCANPDCGAMYCTKFDVTEIEMPVQFRQLRGQR